MPQKTKSPLKSPKRRLKPVEPRELAGVILKAIFDAFYPRPLTSATLGRAIELMIDEIAKAAKRKRDKE